MTISLYINPCTSAVEGAELHDMSGNTGWIRADVTDAEAEILLSENIRDDHGAARYKWEDGMIVERSTEERRREWGEDEPQQPTVDQRMAAAESSIDELNAALDIIIEGRMPE